MHSSRMRTARLLPVSPQHALRWGEGVCLCSGEVSASGPGGIPACNGADTPLWTEFLTHASENITLPQLRYGR